MAFQSKILFRLSSAKWNLGYHFQQEMKAFTLTPQELFIKSHPKIIYILTSSTQVSQRWLNHHFLAYLEHSYLSAPPPWLHDHWGSSVGDVLREEGARGHTCSTSFSQPPWSKSWAMSENFPETSFYQHGCLIETEGWLVCVSTWLCYSTQFFNQTLI